MEKLNAVIDDVVACLRPLVYGGGAVVLLLLLAATPTLVANFLSGPSASTVTEPLSHFASSQLIQTFITSAFGAFAGAFIAARAYTKRAVIAELNAVSAATTLCFTICSLAIMFKKQQVRPLKQRYEQALEAYVSGKQGNLRNRALGLPLQFEPLATDWQTLTVPKMPTQGLEKGIFEKTSIRSHRTLAAAAFLIGVVDSLERDVEYRDTLLDEQKKNPREGHALAAFYFGFPTATVLDERVKVNIEALDRHTDDCIFFSLLLSEDLFAYGTKLRKRYAWRFRLGIPKSEPANWSIAHQDNLIPAREEYKDWLRGFVDRPSRYRRVMRWLFRQIVN